MQTGNQHTVRCDFCGGEMIAEPFVAITGAWTCQSCSYVECRPRPSREELDALYGNIGYHRFTTVREDLLLEVRAYDDFARRLTRVVPPGALVIEVGAATGALVKAMHQRGLDAKGIDISSAAAQVARDLLDVDVQTAPVEEASYPDSVQAIVAFHVLEHLLKPATFLASAGEALPPGGWLILEVPDYAARMRLQLGSDWPYYIPGEHLQHFSEESLRNILPRFGFAVRRAERVGGLGLLQDGSALEGIASQSTSPIPLGWRGLLYRARTYVYAVPGARRIVRRVNAAVGYGLLHRNAHVRVWAQKQHGPSDGFR